MSTGHITEAEFIQRFGDRLIAVVRDDEASLRKYAEQVAPTYYQDPDYYGDGHDPEECADVDMSYWED